MKTSQKVGAEVLTISLSSKILLRELLSVGRAVNPNPIVAVMENVSVKISTGKVEFTGDNLSQSITSVLDYNVIGETGNFLLPHKKTVELLKTLPDVPVSITHTREGNACSVQITMEGKKFKLSSEPWEEYPKPKLLAFNEFVFPANQMREAFTKCLLTVSTDDLRPAMTGVHIQAQTGDIVSTNGHALTLYRTGLPMEGNPFTVPASFAKLVLESIPEDQENVILEVSSSTVQISNERLTITSRLIDERYVDYENAVPKDLPLKGIIVINEWSTAMRRALIFSDATTLTVKNTFDHGRLTLQSEDTNYETDSVQEIGFEGDFEITIGLNGKLATGILQKLDSDTARIEMMASNRAILVYPDNTLAKELIILLMPVYLQE